MIFPKHSKLSRTFTFLAWQFGNKNEKKAVIPLRAYCFLTSKQWYEGTTDPDDFSEDVLSPIEKKNAAFIQKFE